MSKEEYEKMLREKAELEAEFDLLVCEEWEAILQELGLPANGGVWEA